MPLCSKLERGRCEALRRRSQYASDLACSSRITADKVHYVKSYRIPGSNKSWADATPLLRSGPRTARPAGPAVTGPSLATKENCAISGRSGSPSIRTDRIPVVSSASAGRDADGSVAHGPSRRISKALGGSHGCRRRHRRRDGRSHWVEARAVVTGGRTVLPGRTYSKTPCNGCLISVK